MLNDLLDKLMGIDPLIWAALAAYFAPYAQDLLNRIQALSRSSNYLVALVLVPAVIAGLTGLAQSDYLSTVHPFVRLVLTGTFAAVVSQLKYGLSLKPRQDVLAELSVLRGSLGLNKAPQGLQVIDAAPAPVAAPLAPTADPELY